MAQWNEEKEAKENGGGLKVSFGKDSQEDKAAAAAVGGPGVKEKKEESKDAGKEDGFEDKSPEKEEADKELSKVLTEIKRFDTVMDNKEQEEKEDKEAKKSAKKLTDEEKQALKIKTDIRKWRRTKHELLESTV